jgi:predicted lactoylglutathione lyase
VSRMIFVNLPVRSVRRSRAFFTRLGFRFNPEFCDDDVLCMVVDDNIFVMMLEWSRIRDFVNGEIADAHRATEVLTCLSAASRTEIDDMVHRAVEAGGRPWKEPMQDGPMYGHSFQDPDGHVWELIHMEQRAAV